MRDVYDVNMTSNVNGVNTTSVSAYHHGDLRAKLLSVVKDLVEEKGAESFSIAEAARLAGVSSAAPYRHFQDKPEILKALVLEEMKLMAEAAPTLLCSQMKILVIEGLLFPSRT